jgi:hypothetical protein
MPQGHPTLVDCGRPFDPAGVSDHDELQSASAIDADAERFLDEHDADAERFLDEHEDEDEDEAGVTSAADLAPDGSLADIIDQHTEVPVDDEP